MNKKYIVNTQGRIFDVQGKTYEIMARNENEAEAIAKNLFVEEYPVIDAQLHAKASGITTPTIIALIALVLAIIPTSIRWTHGHNVISLQPSLISCIFGAAFYASYYVRFKGIKNTFRSWIDVVFCLLLILLFSSFAKALLAERTLKFFFWDVSIDTSVFLIFTVVLSLCGFKFMSVICTIVLFFLSIGNLFELDMAMGHIYGPLYICGSFIGLAAYMATEPALYQGIMDFKNSVAKSSYAFRSDFNYAKNVVKEKSSEIKDSLKN